MMDSESGVGIGSNRGESDCGLKCINERRSYTREMHRWGKNLLCFLGLECIATQMMDRAKKRHSRNAEKSEQNGEMEQGDVKEVSAEKTDSPVDWNANEKCLLCTVGKYRKTAEVKIEENVSATVTPSQSVKAKTTSSSTSVGGSATASSKSQSQQQQQQLTDLLSQQQQLAMAAAGGGAEMMQMLAVQRYFSELFAWAQRHQSPHVAAAAAAQMAAFYSQPMASLYGSSGSPSTSYMPEMFGAYSGLGLSASPVAAPTTPLSTVNRSKPTAVTTSTTPVKKSVKDPKPDNQEQPLDLSGGPPLSTQKKTEGVVGKRASDPLLLSPARTPPPDSVASAMKRNYTQADLEAAVGDIVSGRLGTRRASVVYGIPRSTLRNKVYKLEASSEDGVSGKRPRKTAENSQVSSDANQGASAATNDTPVPSSASCSPTLGTRSSPGSNGSSSNGFDDVLGVQRCLEQTTTLQSDIFARFYCSSILPHVPSRSTPKRPSWPSVGSTRQSGAVSKSVDAAAKSSLMSMFRGSSLELISNNLSLMHSLDHLPPCSSNSPTNSTSTLTRSPVPSRTAMSSNGRSSTPVDAEGRRVRPKRGQYRRYDKTALVQAVNSVRRGEMSVHRAGSYYGVPHSTLEYKVKERNLMRVSTNPKKKSAMTGATTNGLGVNTAPTEQKTTLNGLS